MNGLEIHLFGNVRVNYGESTPELKMTHVSQGLFWGESSDDKARSSLSTALGD
ncbi:MAG: hypothetical protein IIB17_02150 [Chloroflexi bacterium]|nr:hypothetical protein [Chloroflexota bacterium]